MTDRTPSTDRPAAKAVACPQCGNDATEFQEGVCVDCCQQNQWNLDQHNAEYDHWNRLRDEQREEAIRRGYV